MEQKKYLLTEYHTDTDEDSRVVEEFDSFTTAIRNLLAWVYLPAELHEVSTRRIKTEEGAVLVALDKKDWVKYQAHTENMNPGEIAELINAWDVWDPRMLEALAKACKINAESFEKPNGEYDTEAYDAAINASLERHGYPTVEWQ